MFKCWDLWFTHSALLTCEVTFPPDALSEAPLEVVSRTWVSRGPVVARPGGGVARAVGDFSGWSVTCVHMALRGCSRSQHRSASRCSFLSSSPSFWSPRCPHGEGGEGQLLTLKIQVAPFYSRWHVLHSVTSQEAHRWTRLAVPGPRHRRSELSAVSLLSITFYLNAKLVAVLDSVETADEHREESKANVSTCLSSICFSSPLTLW